MGKLYSGVVHKPRYRYRSAVTGRFVSEEYAKRYPKKTVRERVKPAKTC